MAKNHDRPFWTEKSAYIEGDLYYAVGVATHAPTLEIGRQRAFQNGLQEFKNYTQLPHSSLLSIETQMTYEEDAANNTVNVFRLLKTDIKTLQTKNMLQRPLFRNDQSSDKNIINSTKLEQTKINKNKTSPTGIKTINSKVSAYDFWLR